MHSPPVSLSPVPQFGPSPQTWARARKWSTDEGKTWSPAEHLPAGLLGPIRAKPLVLQDGMIVSGTLIEAYRSLPGVLLGFRRLRLVTCLLASSFAME